MARRQWMNDLCERCGSMHDVWYDCSLVADTTTGYESVDMLDYVPLPREEDTDND